jgi:hypothetical protein
MFSLPSSPWLPMASPWSPVNTTTVLSSCPAARNCPSSSPIW